tara:strand:- start:375 stop:926 length:552 start_codon:yes stop_codon:yes gene_type:complete
MNDKMDIQVVDNFFSKTAFRDFWNVFNQPKWELVSNIVKQNDGAGLVRHIGIEENVFYLSLYPIHIISKLLDKEYLCNRMRLRVTWPNKDEGTIPHIDLLDTPEAYDITAIIYMKDSDGDLLIYDSSYPDSFNKKSTYMQITPMANTCVIMKKKYYHHAMRPIKTALRYSININLKEQVAYPN